MLALVGIGLFTLAEARSDGVVGLCDAHGNFGCSEWYSGYGVTRDFIEDRLQCLDDNPGVMYWAKRPDRSDKYELRVEGGATTFAPDELLTLVLDVKDVEYKYRGLLLHAVDQSGTTVGSWEFPDEGEQLFHSPYTCPQAALHVSADLKPYSVRLHWRAPADLDEKITFRCLIKRGPANDGYFHFPNGEAGDLTVDAAPNTAPDGLLVGSAGLSCNEACSAKGLVCDEAGMQNLGSPTDTEADLGKSFACPLPMVKGCANPTASTKKCTFSSDASQASCSYKRTTEQLICACKSGGGRRLLDVEDENERFPPMHNSAMRASFPVLGVIMSMATALIVADTPLATIGLGLLALSQLPGAQAHNWLLSNGRASNQASTTRPCLPRKATDTHGQVGPGQAIDLLWATGHSNTKNYIVVLPATAFDYLNADELTKIFDAYIDEAPDGNNFALDPKYRRQHGDKREGETCEDMMIDEDGAYYGFFERVLSADDELYVTHPAVEDEQRCMWEYKDTYVAEDVHVSYESTTYPWIESVARFRNINHWPHDFDAARIPIAGRHGAGHYVIYWHWRGYADCVDINVFDSPVPQDLIYGEYTGEYYMNRVDHCQYVKPAAILSECHEVVNGNIDACTDELFKWMPPVATHGFIYGKRAIPRDQGLRVGVNVIPAMKAPAIPDWTGSRGIPTGNNPVCGRSDWLDLTGKGTITTSTAVQWNRKFAPFTQIKEISRCDESARLWYKEDITLLDAIALCARTDCIGIAWHHGQFAEVQEMYKGTHTFEGCSGEPVEVEHTEACVDRPAVADPTAIFRDNEGYTCDDLRARVMTSDGEMWRWCHNASQTARRFPKRMVDGLCMGHACCGCGFSDEDRGGIFSYYSAWTYFGKNFEEDLTGATSDTAGEIEPIVNINFQNYYSLLSEEDSAVFPFFDKGMAYSSHGAGLDQHSYGWVCPGRDESLQFVPELKDLANPNGPRDTNPVLVETKADITVARKLDMAYCPDKHTHATWEYEVPSPGVYQVEMMIGNPEGDENTSIIFGCSIEGDQISPERVGRGVFTKDVEVLDGKLTFSHQSNPTPYKCDGISWIKIRKKPEARLPTPTWVEGAVQEDPWWQMELAQSTAIGAVTVDFMSDDDKDCSTRWLFKGTSCAGSPIMGYFDDEENEGAIVGVSDNPCEEGKRCSGTVCGRIDKAVGTCSGSLDCQLANTKYQTTIDCKGAKGKYVWIQLPGRRRILAALDVKVNRYLPETTASGNPVGPETLLCYGVEARVQTAVEPEYEVTNDPTDPIFYSTCYVREREVKWLGDTPDEPTTRWRFNGHCVDCADVAENALMKDTPPLWRLSAPDQCEDCDTLDEQCPLPFQLGTPLRRMGERRRIVRSTVQ